MSTQSKGWMFTLNNPDSDVLDTSPYQFITWQRESGESGTPHLQGYVWLKKKTTLAGVKKLLPTAHWEPRRGSHEEAVAYCNKEDTRVEGPWTEGEPPAQGKRNDLHVVAKSILDGMPLSEVAQIYPVQYIHYHRGFNALRLATTKHRDPTVAPDVTVYWGPTGTGKSRTAYEAAPEAYWLPQGKWFDTYEGQETVIIDEFYGWLPYSFVLRLLDRYPMLVETKGGQLRFVSSRIIFTSNKPPWEWYDVSFDQGPLERRISRILYCGALGEAPVPTPWPHPLEPYATGGRQPGVSSLSGRRESFYKPRS